MIVNNLNIAYTKKGSGDFVFILHGWGSNKEIFNNIVDVMAQKYCVIVPDLPGFGESDEPKKPWCVDDYVDFAIDFISQFKPKKIILLGHSFGGRVIIKMANRKTPPFEIEKIILIDAAGIKAKKSIKQKIKLLVFKIIKHFLPKKILNKLKNKIGSSDYRSASPMMKEILIRVVNEDLSHLLSGISYETLLIWGKYDTATPLKDGQLMEKEIKKSGLVTLEAGHYSFLEQPIIFNNVIKSFLEIK